MSAPYYSDDLVTLWHGDCLEVTAWLEADALVTDPPYGMAYVNRHGRAISGDNDCAARDGALLMWGEGRPALVFGTWKVERPTGVRQVMVWDKSGGNGFGSTRYPWGNTHEDVYLIGKWPKIKAAGRARDGFTPAISHSVLRFPVQNSMAGDRPDHPTPKPPALMEHLISKCPPGVVADPFAGSGTTLLAAKAIGRKAIGVEIDERYCEMAAKRLSQDTLFGEAS